MVTVITKTIGPTGRDYTTFTLAEADVTNIGTSADLVANDEAIVFEADDTTFTAASPLYIASTALTVDATRNVSYTAASGRPVYEYTGTGTGISFYDPYTRWSGIDVLAGSAYMAMQVRANSGYGTAQAGTIIENATITAASNAVRCEKFATGHALGTSSEPTTLRNLVTKANVAVGQFISGTGHTTGAHCLVVNCTHLGGSSPNQAWNWALTGGMPDASFKIINCANLAQDTSNDANITGGGCDVSGSTNNIGNAAAPTSSFRFENIGGGIGAQYTPSTAYDPGAGDFALYVSSTGQLLDSPHNDVIDQGVGPTVNADVPTTDIVGRARTRSVTNPGAFAVAQATRVVTKTIGPSGRDYATFTLAEAAVETIATAEFGSTDLVANNGRIEFLADAGTYSESVTFSSSLTTDATRQVTYKPAAGSEHGGVQGAGVHVTSASSFTLRVYDQNMALIGLSAHSSHSTGKALLGSQSPFSCDSCIFAIDHGVIGVGAAQLNPGQVGLMLFTNCVFERTGTANDVVYVPTYSATPISVELQSCTLRNGHILLNNTTASGVINLESVNALALGSKAYQILGSGTVNASGSNNFGPASNPFPAALQGSPYPITATTNTDPGPGHFAIYDADTGALVNVAANTVWQRGVGPSANSDVPTTDIAGFTRSGATANPGAFAASTSLAQTTNPVARFFTYKRPSSQLFNHHRRVTCVFPDDGPSGNANTFAVGVAARGFISPVSRDCVAFFVYYTTDGAGGQTSLRLEVARIVGQYSQDAIAEAQPIAVVEKQAVGEAIPAGFDFPGQSHTVAFRVQTFGGATTPESAAEYTAYIDGTAVTFDTFYQSATQDGTTKVVTHPAPAVGTTQGRAEAFFWYATADRTDSLGSENYALPQWSDWNQLAVDPDPIFDGEGQSITVEGEGTGTVNFSTALEHVDFAISVQYELPRFDTPFASGHRYTSPRFENSRRVITASATNIDKATMDLIVQFHAARKGIEEPFLFNFPIPDTTTSETYTVITVQFADTAGMVYRRDAENIYSVQLNMIELL